MRKELRNFRTVIVIAVLGIAEVNSFGVRTTRKVVNFSCNLVYL